MEAWYEDVSVVAVSPFGPSSISCSFDEVISVVERGQ